MITAAARTAAARMPPKTMLNSAERLLAQLMIAEAIAPQIQTALSTAIILSDMSQTGCHASLTGLPSLRGHNPIQTQVRQTISRAARIAIQTRHEPSIASPLSSPM